MIFGGGLGDESAATSGNVGNGKGEKPSVCRIHNEDYVYKKREGNR